MKTLFEKLSKEHQAKVLAEAEERPATWKDIMEELNTKYYFTDLTFISVHLVWEAIYSYQPFTISGYQNLWNHV